MLGQLLPSSSAEPIPPVPEIPQLHDLPEKLSLNGIVPKRLGQSFEHIAAGASFLMARPAKGW
jgi:hypothetical protein